MGRGGARGRADRLEMDVTAVGLGLDAGGELWLQSVDGFPALVEDPWRNARLTTLHACSDLWACGASLRGGEGTVLGAFLGVVLDTALPDATPPRPDLRRMHIPLGPVAVFAASNFPNTDRAWVRVDNNHSLLPVVDGENQGDIPVYGSTEAPVGAAVCRSGRTTGLHCGTIEAKNVTVQYPGESVNGLTQVKVCAEGGDSGGSFITTPGQAQGVLSGGNYSCKGKQANLATSYFQPINPLLQAYGLTLKTSQ